MFFDILWGLWWPLWPKLAEKYMQICKFWQPILNIQIGASIFCGEIFNDHLWSYMIETDMSACVLTFYRICDNLQDKKLVKIMAKIQVLSPLNPEYLIWCLDISMVICDWKWYAIMCFDLFSYLWWAPLQKICQKYATHTDFAPSESRTSDLVPK